MINIYLKRQVKAILLYIFLFSLNIFKTKTTSMKKLFLILTLPVAMLLLLPGGIFAQDMKLGMAIKASTMGPGGDLVLQFHKRMDVRLGIDMFDYSRTFSFDEDDIEYDAHAKIETGSYTALFDYYIAKGFFVALGAGINNFNINIKGEPTEDVEWGDVIIDKEKIGDFEFGIEPGLKLSPYFGIGFGHALSANKLVGFAFEIGSYYMGSPDVSIEATGLLSPTAMEEYGQEALFESQLSSYGFYPVLKFSLNFKLASL